MIRVEKVTYHDKKRNKIWYMVNGFYNTIRFIGITETNTKEKETKVNWLTVHNTEPEEEKEAEKHGLKGDQSILTLLSNEDIETIIKAVKEQLRA